MVFQLSLHSVPARVAALRKELVAQSCSTLWDPMACSSPGFFVLGVSQARILEWVAISFSRDSSDPGIVPASLALAGGLLCSR